MALTIGRSIAGSRSDPTDRRLDEERIGLPLLPLRIAVRGQTLAASKSNGATRLPINAERKFGAARPVRSTWFAMVLQRGRRRRAFQRWS